MCGSFVYPSYFLSYERGKEERKKEERRKRTKLKFTRSIFSTVRRSKGTLGLYFT